MASLSRPQSYFRELARAAKIHMLNKHASLSSANTPSLFSGVFKLYKFPICFSANSCQVICCCLLPLVGAPTPTYTLHWEVSGCFLIIPQYFYPYIPISWWGWSLDAGFTFYDNDKHFNKQTFFDITWRDTRTDLKQILIFFLSACRSNFNVIIALLFWPQ